MTIADELYKPSQTADKPQSINRISCGLGDTAAFQILLNTGNKSCIVNTGTAPALSRMISLPIYRTEVICDFAVTQFTEGYLPDENGVMFADPLFSDPHRLYNGNVSPAVWAELSVPNDTKPGSYQIKVNLYETRGANDEKKIAEKAIGLKVYGCVMPSKADYSLYLDLWQHNSNLARYYGTELWSNEHFFHIEKALETLSELGQKSATVLCGDCPWQGWGCYLMKNTPADLYEYSSVSVLRNKCGVFTFDFSNLERYIRLCEKYGIDGDISVYGLIGIWKMPLFPAGAVEHFERVLVRYLDECDGCYKYMKSTADIKLYIEELFAFFKKANVWDKVYLCADEPSDMTAYRKSADFLRSIDRTVKFKLAIDHAEVIDDFCSDLSCCASSFPCTVNKHDFLLNYKNSTGGKLLYYVCNIPDKPNTVFKSTLAETRFLGTLTYLLGFDGFLRWTHYCWTVNPTEDVRYNDTALPTGDVCFVYPDKRGGFIKSLRFKALKKGIEDFELLKRVDAKIARKATETIALNTDFSSYMADDRHTVPNIFSTDSSDYFEMREFLLSKLSEEV